MFDKSRSFGTMKSNRTVSGFSPVEMTPVGTDAQTRSASVAPTLPSTLSNTPLLLKSIQPQASAGAPVTLVTYKSTLNTWPGMNSTDPGKLIERSSSATSPTAPTEG